MEDHEQLENLRGGDESGHYHLTLEQLEWLIEHMAECYKPSIHDNQVLVIPADSENYEYQIDSDRT